MVEARIYLWYHVYDPDLTKEGQRIATIGEAFEKIKQKHGLEGEAEQCIPYIISMGLIQEPQVLRDAFEDLINSEAGMPCRVCPSKSFEEYNVQEEKLGYRIAQEVLALFGYSLDNSLVVEKKKN